MSDLRYEDRTDFDDADRGLVGALEPCVVRDDEGRVGSRATPG
jgi:alkyl sulfatase BDS1-like metallo-beta-lactamase superfamily hydrolase